MNTQSAPHSHSSLRGSSRICAALVILLGASVLVGWAFDIAALKSVFHGLVTMKANTAVGLLLAGVSLWLWQQEPGGKTTRRIAQACAAAVMLIGVLTLSQYLFGWELGIDHLLFRKALGAEDTTYPGRMAPQTTLNHILVGGALLLLAVETRRGHRPAEYFALAALFVAVVALLGYLYSAATLYRLVSYTAIGLHTAIAFIILCAGILLSRPDRGLMAVVTSRSLGGALARRLLPASLLALLALDWLSTVGVRAGLYDEALALPLAFVAGGVILAALIWWNARALDRADAARELAEGAARQQREWFEMTLGSIGDAVIATDAAGRVMFINHVAASLTGWAPTEAAGQPLPAIFRIINEATRATVENPVSQVIREGVILGLANHTILVAKDGAERPIDDSGAPIRDEKGKIIGVVLVFRDITERRLAEDKFRLAVESSPNAVVMINEEGRMILVNSQTEQLFDYSREELIGQPIEMLVPERFRRQHPEYRAGFAAAPQARPMGTGRDLFGLRKDGSEVSIEIGLNPIEVRGKTLVLSSIVDITARKQAEAEREQLLQREQAARAQAEAASRIKDEFLSTVSHELRTPLNSILGWAHLLRHNPSLDAEAARALETIERNARAQNRLIEDLLDISRITSGKLRLDVRPIEPALIVEAAVEAARPAAEAKAIRLQMILDPRTGPISGDSDRLQQIVWNLVSNAIKFTPKGGRVQVRLERINSHIEIIVSDTGQGISPEFLPYVFERFRQADSAITRKTGGLGLGLAIVRHLVELHGGRVRVESPGEGQGATFRVELPLMITHATASGYQPERVHPAVGSEFKLEGVPRLDGVRILVVDDEADAREMLTAMLVPIGAEVRAAGGKDEALAVLDAWWPDLLVSDIGMPDGDGYELMREVRARETQSGGQSPRLPAVALTAYARTEDRMRALTAGYQMHITKPVEPAELVTVLASLAGRLRQGIGL